MSNDQECEVNEPLNVQQIPKVVTIPLSDPNKFTEEQPVAEFSPPDGGWRAWLVCLASFYANGAMFGMINSAGTMYVKLEDLYGEDSSRTSLVGSLAIGTTFLLSPIASILTDRLGIRKTALLGSALVLLGMVLSSIANSLNMLYATYGILFGAGVSMAYTPSLVILGHYFKRNLGIVNGIVSAGSSLFTIVTPFLITELTSKYGLPTTFRIFAGIMSPLLLCALIFKPLSAAKSRPPPSIRRDSSDRCANCCTQIINVSVWKNKKYLIWAIAFPVALVGYFVPYTHLVKHTKDILPGYNGDLLITCIGAASLVGRLIIGKIADIHNVNRIFLQQLAFFLLGVSTMLLAATSTYWVLLTVCLGLGLFDGCFISLLGPIAFDIVGMKGASQAIGFLLGVCAFPLTFGSPMAGWMYDNMGKDYKIAFLAAGVPPIVGSLLMFTIRLVKQPILNDECNNIDTSNIKPSITETTVLSSSFIEQEDQKDIWKLRPEFQNKIENGKPQDFVSEDQKVIIKNGKNIDTNEVFTERQSTC